MDVGRCKETGKIPEREIRRQVVTLDKRGNEHVENVHQGRVYTTAFDTGWVDLSNDNEADVAAWNAVNPPPPPPPVTTVVTNN